MNSRTTVVIVTRDRADELRVTLTHLAQLDPPPPVIVVDNGSTDSTRDVVQQAAARGDSRAVTLIALSHNAGGAARNRGVAAATTPFVAFSDDDSWWAPGALTQAEALFDRYPRLGLVAARTKVGPEEREDPVNAMMADSALGTAPNAPGPSILGFIACGSIVRKEAFEATDGFSPVIEFPGEEETVALDLATAGWELCYVDSIVSHHHPSSFRMPSTARQARELRNRTLTVWLRRPLARAVTDTGRLAAASFTDEVARKALFETARKLPAALRDRRVVPGDVEGRVRLLEGAA